MPPEIYIQTGESCSASHWCLNGKAEDGAEPYQWANFRGLSRLSPRDSDPHTNFWQTPERATCALDQISRVNACVLISFHHSLLFATSNFLAAMAFSFLSSLRVLFFLLPLVSFALKFDLFAESRPAERCIRNFVNKDTLVVVTATISGNRGDGQRVDMHVGQIGAFSYTPGCAPKHETTSSRR